MDDAPVSPEAQARNRKLFTPLMGWLLMTGRRPGMLGAASALVGKIDGAAARLDRAEDGWLLSARNRRESLDTAGVVRLIGSRQFFPLQVEVIPDLAELLFMEAVHQAETSLTKLSMAAPHIDELSRSGFERNAKAWVLATSELDRAVRAAMSSVVLAVAAGEAQVNSWAAELGGWQDDEDRLNVAEKCVTLARRVGAEAELGRPPFQPLAVAVKRRNGFVHSKPLPEPVPAVGANAPVPAKTISIEARATCLAVRRSFVELARLLSFDLPPYLAHCPETDPSDDSTWRSANIMTGVRHDPDFPTTGE